MSKAIRMVVMHTHFPKAFSPVDNCPGGQFPHFPQGSFCLYIDQTWFTVILVLQDKASQCPPRSLFVTVKGLSTPLGVEVSLIWVALSYIGLTLSTNRPRGKCMPGQMSYMTLIDKSLPPNFRPRKFEQRTSDYLSVLVGRYLIFAQGTALKNVVWANRPRGESSMGWIDHRANRPTFGRNAGYSGRNALLPLN